MFEPIEFSAGPGGPLHGVRIVDLSRLVAGNMLTMALGDLGADVIKIEPQNGDTLREWRVSGVETAWKAYSRNKRSLCLDFRNPCSREILLRLVRSAHVLVESFRPGTLEQMQLPTQALLQANQALVIARISGWGQSGPYAQLPGFGTLVEGMSGFASMNGFADREPVLPPIYLGDMTAGTLWRDRGPYCASPGRSKWRSRAGDRCPFARSLVLHTRSQAANYRLTGKVSRAPAAARLTVPAQRVPHIRQRWVCLSASTKNMTERLFRAIGRPELIADPRFASNTNRLKNVTELDRDPLPPLSPSAHSRIVSSSLPMPV